MPRLEQSGPPATGLDSRACSLAGCVALAAAAMGPALAVVLNAPAATPAAGGALPLAFLVALLASLLVGNTVATFARLSPPSAGSFYGFAALGLGPAGGFAAGWLLAFGYAAFAPGLFTAFGDFASGYARARFGFDAPWWAFSLAGFALVTAVALRGARASVRAELALLGAELGVFLLLAVVALAGAAPDRVAAGFQPRSSPTGWSGVGVGVVFGVLSFVGFDAAATLGEETPDARRTVPRAVGATLAVCGMFYLVVVTALVAAGDPAADNPVLALAEAHAPWLTDTVALCSVASLFSCALAVQTATARVLFAMGRDGVLPRVLGRVGRRQRSPYAATLVLAAVTVATGLSLGVRLGPGPAGAYGLTGAVGSLAVVAVWMIGGLALIGFAPRTRQRHPVRTFALPVLSVAVLAYPVWSLATAGDAPGQSYRSAWAPLGVLAWGGLGTAAYVWLRRQRPEALGKIGTALARPTNSLEVQEDPS